MILLCGSSTWLVVIEVEGLVYKVCLILKKEKRFIIKTRLGVNKVKPKGWFCGFGDWGFTIMILLKMVEYSGSFLL